VELTSTSEASKGKCAHAASPVRPPRGGVDVRATSLQALLCTLGIREPTLHSERECNGKLACKPLNPPPRA